MLAFRNVIRGVDRVRRPYAGLARKHRDTPPELLAITWIDGLPGYVSRKRGGVVQTTALKLRDGRIAAVYIMRNPDKLAHVHALHAAEVTPRG